MKTRTLITSKVIAPRTCRVCTEPYTPRWEEQETCGGRCARVWGGRQHRGTIPKAFAATIERRIAARNDAVRAQCRALFGDLSVREIEIFKFAGLEGYRRGYAVGIKHQRRRTTEAA